MNKVTYRVTLDLKRPGVQHTIYAKRDDAHSREVVFTLRAGSKAYSIDENTSAYLYALADGAEIFADCVISGSMITAELTTNILNAKNILLELRLTDGTGAVLTTPQVKVVSEMALYSENAITATNDYSALLNAITRAENARIVNITAEGNVLSITYADGQTVSVELNITVEDGGGIDFTPGNALELTDDDVLNVKTTDEVSKTNTLPLTSKGAAALEEAIRKDIPDMPNVPVQSVNGQTGDVKLNADDVGARSSNWMPTAEQVGALPKDTAIPSKTSQLTNDSGFITKAVSDLANYYTKNQTLTKAEINALVSAIPKFAISVVTVLPTSNISATTVYLVKSGTGNDLYTEYIYTNGAWEILGSQKVDLTGYATETWVNGKLADYLPTSQLQSAINDALAQAKASGEFKGEKGDKGDTGATGANGKDGQNGKDGTSVTVTNVTTSPADGGSNVVTFSDGKTLTVLNGSKGSKGEKGDKGDSIKGDKGDKGDAGETGATGATGKDGKDAGYILSEGETLEDAPADVDVIFDPNGGGADCIYAPEKANVGQTIMVKAVDENGKPTEWEAVDFPEGGGVTSWNDLTVKPFGYGTPIVVADEKDVPFNEEVGGHFFPASSPIEVGDMLEVTLAGTTYTTTASMVGADGITYFGNLGLLGMPDTGEPFLGGYMDGMVMIAQPDFADPVDIKIAKNTLVKIPSEYLPETTRFYVNNTGSAPYLHIDPQCTVRATMNDIPDGIDFEVDFVSGSLVVYRHRPLMVFGKLYAALEGYSMVTVMSGGTIIGFYTAEYTPPATAEE